MKRFTLHLFIASLTFIIGVSISALTHRGSKRPDVNVSAWKTLLSFENQDLSKLDEQTYTRLHQAIEILVGKPTTNEFPRYYSPLWISEMSNAQGETRYALVEGEPLEMIPGSSYLRVCLFNTEGKLITSSRFSAYRVALIGAKVVYMPEIGREVLAVSSCPVVSGPDMAQYYALVGNDLLLIRLETGGGNLIRYGSWTIESPITGHSIEDRERAIESNDIAEVLATLTWLSDIRFNPPSAYEETDESRQVDDVRSRESVRLKRLMQSENAWMRSEAELAAKVESNR